MIDVKIKDNFFPAAVEQQISDIFNVNTDICWHFKNNNLSHWDQEHIDNAKKLDSNICENVSAFQHVFYSYCDGNSQSLVDVKSLFESYIKINFNIKVDSIIRILGNFYLPDPNYLDNKYMLPHVDNHGNHYTLLYYINSCSGATYIFNETYNEETSIEYKKTIKQLIVPKKGTAALFNGLTYHAGSPCRFTCKKMINVNFIA